MAYTPEPEISFEDAVAVFKNNPGAIGTLPPKSQSFVSSLCDQLAKKGHLSEKQQFWLRVYAEKVPGASPYATMSQLNPNVDVKAALNKYKEQLEPVKSIDVGDALMHMLKKAGEAAKQKGGKNIPKIKFKKSVNDDTESATYGELISPKIQFHIASKASKHMGCIMVTDGGKFQDSMYYGKIEPGGLYYPNHTASEEIIGFVKKFAANPTELGIYYGTSTKNCCFCGKDITTKESKAAGYGPVCAEKYGLPWGGKPGFVYASTVIGVDQAAGPDSTVELTFNGKSVESLEEQAKKKAMKFIVGGQTIQAIKQVRMILGCSLKEAKTLVEKWKEEMHSAIGHPVDYGMSKKAEDWVDAQDVTHLTGDPHAIIHVDDDEEEPEMTAAELGFSCAACLDTGYVIGSNSKLSPCNHVEEAQCAS